MINILIADDHSFIREGLKKLIASDLNFKLAGEAQNSAEVLSFVLSNECDLIILDINLPGKNGLEILEEIKQIKPKQKTIVLTMYPEKKYATRAFQAGANGYLTKDSPTDELSKAIYKVMDGRKYISENFAEELCDDLSSDKSKQAHELLSNRELQIFIRIGSGKPLNDIAEELSLSRSTINTYRLRVFEKLNFNSNMDIIQYCFKNNLVD